MSTRASLMVNQRIQLAQDMRAEMESELCEINASWRRGEGKKSKYKKAKKSKKEEICHMNLILARLGV